MDQHLRSSVRMYHVPADFSPRQSFQYPAYIVDVAHCYRDTVHHLAGSPMIHLVSYFHPQASRDYRDLKDSHYKILL